MRFMDFTSQLRGKGLIKEIFMLKTKIFIIIPDLDYHICTRNKSQQRTLHRHQIYFLLYTFRKDFLIHRFFPFLFRGAYIKTIPIFHGPRWWKIWALIRVISRTRGLWGPLIIIIGFSPKSDRQKLDKILVL